MGAALIGAFVGLAVALVFFFSSRELARRVELEDTRRALRVSAGVQIVALPAIGFLIGFFFSGD